MFRREMSSAGERCARHSVSLCRIIILDSHSSDFAWQMGLMDGLRRPVIVSQQPAQESLAVNAPTIRRPHG
jgi:hypothetical protein